MINRYFKYVNSKDLAELAGLFSEDAVLTYPLYPPVKGRAAIKGLYEKILGHYVRYRDDPRILFADENRAVVEIGFEGTNSMGQKIEFEAVDLFFLEEGQIKTLKIFYDSARLLQDLGFRILKPE